MEAKALICDQLRLAPQHVRWLGIPGHCAVCLVSHDWLKNVSLETIGGGISENSQTLPPDLCDEYLAASCNSLPPEWFRLVVRIVAKSDDLVDDVLAAPLYCNVKDYCLSDLLTYICQENRKNLYLNACSKLSQQKTVPSRAKKKFSDLFREIVLHFQPHCYIRLDGSQALFSESSLLSSSEDSSRKLFPNIVSTYLFLELENYFLLLQPYYPYNLWDVVSYSPALFNESHAKTLFVLYQILQAMQLGHSIGLSAGHLKLHNVFVDKKLWIDISFSRVSFLLDQSAGSLGLNGTKSSSMLYLPNQDKKSLVEDARTFVSCGLYTVYSIDDLSSVVSDWVHWRISNFKYLMILNHLAGRRLGDPNNHPILPWVSDFTSEHKNFRDLSKTKYRLNKGDRQLDLTYEELPVLSGGPVHRSPYIPHHVSDVLSDITYYVYKARQTSKSILCAHVRPYWVPSEYPASIQRIQQWTPDECIPEFFLEPSIFKSVHHDLPDLGIPDWCVSPQDFIEKHMTLLESPRVSQALHNWIDLTFGHKLSGTASVESKNVHLQLVDNHTHVTNCGVVQLFAQPHPQRILPPKKHSSSFGSVLIDSETDGLEDTFHNISNDTKLDYTWFIDPISFSMDDKPLSKLEQLESLYAFCPKSVCDSEKDTFAQEIGQAPLSAKDLVAHDVQAFACLMCEMFLAPKTRLLGPNATLKERHQLLYKLCQMDLSPIPRPLHQAASILLQLNEDFMPLLSERGPVFNYVPINTLGLPPLTPSLMTHSMIDVIPFPSYFPQLYHSLCQVKQKDHEIECLNFSHAKTPCEKAKMTKVLAREKVSILQVFLQKYEIVLGQEGVDLLLPYVEELLQVKDTAVQCAWILFDLMSRQLGPDVAKNKFLPQITKLYTEDYSTPKHLKLYHHKFLVQLLVRFQLQTFLENFSTLLVEAVAGYKDFVIETDTELPEVVEFRRQKTDFSRRVRNQIPACPEEVSEDSYQGNGQDSSENHAEEGVEGGGSHNTDDYAGVHEFAGGNFLLEDVGSSIDKGDSEKGSDSASVDQDSLKSEESGYKRSLLGIDDADSVFQSGRRFSFPVSIHDRNAGRERSDSGSHPRSNSNTSDRDLPPMGNLLTSAENTDIELENLVYSEKSSQSEGEELEDREGDDDDDDNEEDHIEEDEEESDKTEIFEDCHMLMSQVEGSPSHGSQTGRTDPGMPVTGSVQQGLHMVRSETDEFTRCLAGTSWDEIVNIRDMATESVKWLCHRLGPLLAARYLSLNLIRLLPLCYLDEEQLLPVLENAGNCRKSCHLVGGDTYAVKVLECLSFMAILYGEQVILLQYFPAMEDMVAAAEKEMTQTTEAGLVASLVLMRHMIPLLSEKTLMDLLQDTKLHNILHSVIRLTASNMRFPSGHLARSLICHKIIDVIYIIGVRIGFEMTRKHLTSTMQLFFDSFFQVHCPDACPNSTVEETFNKSEVSAHSSPRLSKAKSKEKPSGSVDSEESEELYWNIKKDGRAQEYKIGSSVNVNDMHQSSPSQAFHRLKSRVKRTSVTGVTNSAAVSTKLKSSADHQIEQRPGTPGPDDQGDLVMEEMKKVFTPELAHTAYIPLCQIFGSIHMEQSLWNDDLIRQLCSQHDSTLDKLPTSGLGQSFDSSLGASTPDLETPDDTKSMESSLDSKENDASLGGIGSNVAVVGNRIQLQHPLRSGHPDMPHINRAYRHTGILNIGQDDLKSTEIESNNQRHLRGNWLAYWEHELGLSDRASVFNFKHIKLQTFLGHNTSIRSLCVLDNENSFISASKDKTVKLWSLTSFGDGSGKCGCQWTYRLHKKSVFSVGFLESVRLVASCDSTVHIWDPFRGECVRQLESSKNSPVIALAPIPAPSCMMITATNDSTLRFLDLRKAEYAHEYRCSPLSAGLIRSVTVSPDSNWVAVAFSSGIVSVLDVRTGTLLGQRKGHDGDILQIKACNRHTFVTSSFDQSMRLWNASDLKEICQFKGASEPVHCIGLYRNQIISATAGNKIGVHSSIDRHATYTSTKLHPEIFKGVLASMAVLPLNRTLLLGADNGAIRLLC